MNERIKELMNQAGTDSSGKWMGLDNAEKFAELIVRECIDIVKPTSHHEAFAQGYMGDVDGLDLLYSKVKQIREHFGVE